VAPVAGAHGVTGVAFAFVGYARGRPQAVALAVVKAVAADAR